MINLLTRTQVDGRGPMDSKLLAARNGAAGHRTMPPGDDGMDFLMSAAPSAAQYRTAAARARALQATTTTPRLKQYLGEMIARYEGRAIDVERSAKA
jgi:hypothetical protein